MTTSFGISNLYILFLLILSALSFVSGYYIIHYLRDCCKSSKRPRLLTLLIFVVPLFVYIFLNFFVWLRLLDHKISDTISFSLVVGILIKLSLKPAGQSTIKLIVQQLDGKTNDVWLDSLDLPIIDVRNKIGEVLGINPLRISIESGKGKFIDDLTKSFLPMIEDSLTTTDFFGFVTVSCYIQIKEEEPQKKRVSIIEDIDREQKKSSLLSLLSRHSLKYGEPIAMLAKIAISPDTKSSFNISAVDKFAAAAPTSMHFINPAYVKILSWDHADSGANDTMSDIGDTNSVSSASTHRANSGSGSGFSLFKRKRSEDKKSFGQPIYNGDTVVLECNGK